MCAAIKEYFKSNQTFAVYLVALIVGLPVLYFILTGVGLELDDMWIALIIFDAAGFAPIIAYGTKHIFGLTDFVPVEEYSGCFPTPTNYWTMPKADKEKYLLGYEYVMVSGDEPPYDYDRHQFCMDDTNLYVDFPPKTIEELIAEAEEISERMRRNHFRHNSCNPFAP